MSRENFIYCFSLDFGITGLDSVVWRFQSAFGREEISNPGSRERKSGRLRRLGQLGMSHGTEGI